MINKKDSYIVKSNSRTFLRRLDIDIVADIDSYFSIYTSIIFSYRTTKLTSSILVTTLSIHELFS